MHGTDEGSSWMVFKKTSPEYVLKIPWIEKKVSEEHSVGLTLLTLLCEPFVV